MLNENHNNWKQKLEELNGSSGEIAPDKNALWEKLHARMGGKKQSKKAVWYWAVAACILFALIIPAIIFNKKTHQINSITIKQRPSKIKNSVSTIIDKKDSVINNNTLSEKNEITIKDKSGKMIRGKEIIKLRLPDTVSVKNLVAETSNNSLQPIDTSSYLKAIIPVKKKLRVIQINELGDPEESRPEIVGNSNKHTFQFKFGNQEIYTNPSVASAEKGFTILKIKTSTN